MDSKVKEIRSFIVRKLAAAYREMKRKDGIDPYRRGFVDALAMAQSYIDKVIGGVSDEK